MSSIHSTKRPFTRTSIPHVSQSLSHPFTVLSSIHHVIYSQSWSIASIYVIQSSCHPFVMSASNHVFYSRCHQFTTPSSPPIIHSPCHQFTLTMSSIHYVIHSRYDHGPCHPFTMSSIHRLSQSPRHSGPISLYQPQVTRPEQLNQTEFLVLLSCCSIFPTAGAAKTFFELKTSKLL